MSSAQPNQDDEGPVISDTTRIVSTILSYQLTHNFSVAVDGAHGSKRMCLLVGPLLYMQDPNRLLPNLALFLPMWDINPKKSKNHRTLIFTSDQVEEVHEIKLKTKNIPVFTKWSKQLSNNREMLSQYKLRWANHPVRINKDGAFIPAKYQMDNETVKIIAGDKIILDLPRYPESWAGPNLNDLEKIHFYRKDHMVATLKCKDQIQAMKIIIEMNLVQDDLKTVPDIFLNGGLADKEEIPTINEQDIELASADQSSQSSFSEETLEDSGKTPKQKRKSKKKTKHNGTLNLNFAGLMKEKFEKLHLPKNQKQATEKDSIEKIISEFKWPIPAGTAPQIEIPQNTDGIFGNEEELLQMEQKAQDPINRSLYQKEVQINFPEKLTVQAPYNLSECCQQLITDDTIKQDLIDYGYTMDNTDVDRYEEVFKQLDQMKPKEYPEFVTGIFLQGRQKTYSQLANNLMSMNFSCRRIRDILSHYRIAKKKHFYQFFHQLIRENLCGIFFESLTRFPYFVIINYFSDAYMRVPQTLSRLAEKFKNDLQFNEKPDKTPNIPFKLDIFPHILLINSVPIFERNETEIWIESDDKMQPTAFTTIVGAIIALLAKTYPAKEQKEILYHGQFTCMFNSLKTLASALPEEIQQRITMKKKSHRSTKVIHVILYAIVQNRIIDFIMKVFQTKNASKAAKEEFVLCIPPLLRLRSCFKMTPLKYEFQFAKELEKDLIKLFSRDPPKKKPLEKTIDKKKGENSSILDQTKEKLTQIADQAKEAAEIIQKKGEEIKEEIEKKG